MSNTSSLVALKDVIYKLQLCLLDGIKSETQLLVAGSLLSKSDYHDVVTERSIAQMCGYPLCHNSLPSSEPPKKGRYTISLKEHKVYDLLETRMYCSTKCVVNSRAYEQSLQDERSLDFDTSKIDKVVRLFEDLNLKNEEGVGDLGLSNLSIKEKEDENAGRGVMSMEEWIGPSNAIEGYVPQHDRSSKNRSGSKGKDEKLKREVKKQESMLDELNFTSSIIMHGDEYNISKKPSGSKVKDEKLKREVKKQESMLDELNFTSSIILQGDEYNISKKPSGSKVKDEKLKREVKKQESMLDELNFTSSIIMQGDEYNISKKPSGSKVKDDKLRREVKKQESMFDELNFMSSIITQGDEYSISKKPSGQTKLKKKHTKLNDEEKCETHEPSGTGIDQPSCSSGLKSCLKLKSCSGENAAAIKRNVTWADDEADSNTKTQVFENETENHKDFGISEDQLASAEIRAQAEGQLVDSRDVDSVSEAGQLAPLEGPVDPEPAQVKWSKKTGIVESDFFDSQDSWFDTPPEEFVLDLSPFAKMFMSLFAWVSSSTLTYVYGGEDSSAEEHYSSINGREYPQKIFLADGRSSEIKLTLATCLARALPGLVRHLRLATPVSTIEYAMGCLLETMSFVDPLPALRMKQWHVFILLFLEALSVSRIPALAPQLTNTSFFHKVFEDGQISREEYEVLKDLILPLGRAPQFAMQSGA
ncbi:hypothetical protein QVD17_22647 [Tagetes erecta]|uniref:RNA polymerase II subunit B1 CTD phosphatase RPAP2 homolog n=1 Tax=Tagetes erecta TaxID=13708 RepID=A0AAD8NTR3_TARER|nr:hypothetical protein QVD17_22647 [Tagetes erecta]